MYRKLMFLIALVVLLGLTGSLSAVTWDGSTDNLWWTPLNWDTDTVPGPGDTVTLAPAGYDPVIIDRDTAFGSIQGPCWHSNGTQTLNITGGNILFNQLTRDQDAVGQQIINISGSPTIVCTGLWRCPDRGNNQLNISGTPTISVGDELRASDEDNGFWTVNMSGGIVVCGNSFVIGDDGGGVFNISGGSFTTANRIVMASRMSPTATFNVSGTAQVTCASVQLGKSCKTVLGVAKMNMSGGTVNATQAIYVGGNGTEGFCGKASLNMTGGLIVSGGPLDIGAGDDANLVAGTIEVSALTVAATGWIDIKGIKDVAKIILPGNQMAAVSALVSAGKLKGNGSSRLVGVDYNVTTPGKTTVYYDHTIDLCQTYAPVPANGAINVQSVVTPVTLRWTRGDCTYAQTRDFVYLGTDKAAVEAATTSSPEYLSPPVPLASLAQKIVGNKPLWTTYYWRVDEQCLVGGVSKLVKGNVWSFTTGCASITGDSNLDCLLNFADYANLAQVWQQSQYWP